MTPQEFIKLLSDKIDKIKDFPVLKSLAIAQSCLESRYGEKSFYGNIFGIKCHDPNLYAGCRLGKTAEFVNGNYKNLSLAFQTYNNFDESLEDYARIMNLPRYKLVREAKDYLEATEAIRACGYATSISYTINLRKIIEKYKLYELDYKMDKNTQLTRDFKWGEFWCQGQEPPLEYYDNIMELAHKLQILRDWFRKPIIITSGWRTPEHNKKVGGAKNSQHLYGKAADIKMVGVPTKDLLIVAKKMKLFKGIGYSPNFLHVDTRNKQAYWNY